MAEITFFDMSYSETVDEPTTGCYVCADYSDEGCMLDDEIQSFDSLDIDPVKGCGEPLIELDG